jgi:hypothetical protein
MHALPALASRGIFLAGKRLDTDSIVGYLVTNSYPNQHFSNHQIPKTAVLSLSLLVQSLPDNSCVDCENILVLNQIMHVAVNHDGNVSSRTQTSYSWPCPPPSHSLPALSLHVCYLPACVSPLLAFSLLYQMEQVSVNMRKIMSAPQRWPTYRQSEPC